MANRKQPDRWESSIIAAFMALAGTLFLFDKLGYFMRTGLISLSSALHAAPMFLVVLGVSLMLADQGEMTGKPGNQRAKEGHHE